MIKKDKFDKTGGLSGRRFAGSYAEGRPERPPEALLRKERRFGDFS